MPDRRGLGVLVLAAALGSSACGTTVDDATLYRAEAAADPVVAEIAAPTTTTAAAPTTTTTAAPPAEPTIPAIATDPDGLARQIADAEATIRDPASSPAALAEAALVQQLAYRQLGAHPEWDARVLELVPEQFHLSVQRNAQARREFRGMHTRLSETLPAWRIIEPEPADVLLGHYQDAEAEFGIRWQYLAAINLVETGMGRIRGVSSAGAQGPMQFIPSTWEAFGEGDVNDPRDAIFAAARYLNHNGGHEGDIAGALWNYNHHNNYVRGVMAYADVMFDDPRTYYGFHEWEVVFLSARGDIVLFPGYEQAEPIAVDDYLASR